MIHNEVTNCDDDYNNIIHCRNWYFTTVVVIFHKSSQVESVCDPFMRTIFQLLDDEWKRGGVEAHVCAGEHVRYGVVYWRRASEWRDLIHEYPSEFSYYIWIFECNRYSELESRPLFRNISIRRLFLPMIFLNSVFCIYEIRITYCVWCLSRGIYVHHSIRMKYDKNRRQSPLSVWFYNLYSVNSIYTV